MSPVHFLSSPPLFWRGKPRTRSLSPFIPIVYLHIVIFRLDAVGEVPLKNFKKKRNPGLEGLLVGLMKEFKRRPLSTLVRLLGIISNETKRRGGPRVMECAVNV